MSPSPSDIHGVVLDADNTLFTLSCTIGSVYSRVGSEFGLSLPAEQIDGIVFQVWKEHRSKYLNVSEQYCTSPEKEKLFWMNFIETLLSDACQECVEPPVLDAIYHWFSRAESRTLSPYISDFLTGIQERGIPLAVFSNNDQRLLPLLDELNLSPFFQSVYTSGSIGYKKPSQRAFQKISENMKIPANKLLYIGDNPELDYEAARNSGWHAALYSRTIEKSEWPNFCCFSDLLQWFNS